MHTVVSLIVSICLVITPITAMGGCIYHNRMEYGVKDIRDTMRDDICPTYVENRYQAEIRGERYYDPEEFYFSIPGRGMSNRFKELLCEEWYYHCYGPYRKW